MAKKKKGPRPWIVTPHGPLEAHDDNLWSVGGDVPGIPDFPRRMQIIRLSDGRLVFHNAIPVDDATLEKIRALGRPAILVVPHRAHMIDAHPFREKLGLEVYCPSMEREAVSRRVPVAGDYAAFPKDPALRIEHIEGAKREAVLIVTSGPRTNLVFCDAVSNVPHGRGLRGTLMKLVGFTGTPRTNPIFRRFFTADKKTLGRSIARLADLPGLATVVPSHGPAFTDASAALRAAARALGG